MSDRIKIKFKKDSIEIQCAPSKRLLNNVFYLKHVNDSETRVKTPSKEENETN